MGGSTGVNNPATVIRSLQRHVINRRDQTRLVLGRLAHGVIGDEGLLLLWQIVGPRSEEARSTNWAPGSEPGLRWCGGPRSGGPLWVNNPRSSGWARVTRPGLVAPTAATPCAVARRGRNTATAVGVAASGSAVATTASSAPTATATGSLPLAVPAPFSSSTPIVGERTAAGRGVGGGDEGSGVGGDAVSGVAHFCQQQRRAGTGEGGERRLQGKEVRLGGEAGTETTDEVEDECAVGDGLAEVAEGVGESLEATAVLRHRHVALIETAKFGLEVDDASLLVVSEKVLRSKPQSVSALLGLHDDVQDVVGDGVVEGGEDGEVVLGPGGIVNGGDRADDV